MSETLTTEELARLRSLVSLQRRKLSEADSGAKKAQQALDEARIANDKIFQVFAAKKLDPPHDAPTGRPTSEPIVDVG